MRLAGKKLLAIDWDRKHLRLVLVRPRADGIDLLKAASVPIPPEVAMDDAASLGAFLREAMRQARIGAKRALLNIPRDQVVLNSLSLPPSPVEDLPSIVQFQVVKELPFAAEQATLDFAVCGRFDPKETNDVLVAAVRNEKLDFYRKVTQEAGLTVERIGLRPHANLIAVLTKSPELEKKSLLVVEVGPQLTEIDIIRKGVLAFSRAASVALPDLEASHADRLDDSRIVAPPVPDRRPDETSSEAVSALMVEVIRSFEAYRATEPGAAVDRVVVCGATGIEPHLAESLASRFSARAELYTPDRALNLTPQRAKELRGFSAALGLAMGHAARGASHFDFLHPKKTVSKRAVRLKKAPVAALTAALFIASGVVLYYRQIVPLKAQVATRSKAVDAKRKEEKAILAFKNRVDALEGWQKSEQYWPEVLVALTEVFPPDREAFVTRLDFETKRPKKKKSALRPSTMRMRLRTSDLGKVNKLSAKLRDIGLLDVRTGKELPSSGRGGGEQIYHFDTSIEAELPLRRRPKVEDTIDGADATQDENMDAAGADHPGGAASPGAAKPGEQPSGGTGGAKAAPPAERGSKTKGEPSAHSAASADVHQSAQPASGTKTGAGGLIREKPEDDKSEPSKARSDPAASLGAASRRAGDNIAAPGGTAP